MFEIGFSEILLVALVTLLVFGPERLPGAARTAGLLIGRLKRSFHSIKADLERELGADEIRRQLHNEEILQMEREFKRLQQQSPSETASAAPEPPAVAETPAEAPAEPAAQPPEKPQQP